MIEEKYFLVVMGAFERGAVEFEKYPTSEEIISEMIKQGGTSARVEKRFVIAKGSLNIEIK